MGFAGQLRGIMQLNCVKKKSIIKETRKKGFLGRKSDIQFKRFFKIIWNLSLSDSINRSMLYEL